MSQDSEQASLATDASPLLLPPPDTQAQALIPAPQGRRHWAVLIAILFLLAISAATVSFMASGRGSQSTNDAYVEGRVVRISPRVAGQVLAAARR